MRSHSNVLAAFVRDTRGGLSISFGLLAVMLVAMIGAALDFGRWSNANSKTMAALDASLLAAGRQLQSEPDQTQKALDAAQVYFTELTKTRLSLDNPEAQFGYTDNGNSIEGTAKGSIKTPFLGFVSVTALDVNATSKATLSVGGNGGNSDLEISLMLDVTGSMCANGIGPCASSPKLDTLKTAAKDLVNVVMGSGNTSAAARVALVPFSTRVRLGDPNDVSVQALMKKVTNLDPKWSGWYNVCTSGSGSGGSEDAGNWTCNASQSTHFTDWKVMPCVSDRTGPDALTDAAPASNSWLNAHEGGRFPLSADSSDTPYPWNLGLTQAAPANHWNYSPDGDCADILPGNVILPLSDDKTMINARIDALEGFGSTAGAMGTAWSWYVLSPNWSGIWTGTSTPGPYSDLTPPSASEPPKLRKIAVLMTDGLYNTTRGWKDADPVEVSNDAKQICTNMKAAGVEVFTVGFNLDELSPSDRTRATDTLQSCGNDLEHFYNALDNVQLQNAFRDIAMKLATLYIAK